MLTSSMLITIRAFAVLVEHLGWSERQLDVEEHLTVRELLLMVLPDHAPLPAMLVAMDQEYVQPDTPLRDGCEIALIPPLGGG